MPAHLVIDPLISVSVRIPESILAQLTVQAKQVGVTFADQFRSHLSLSAVKPLGVPVRRHRNLPPLAFTRSADPALLRSLAAIGSNLNQMARAVNTGAIAGELVQAIEVLVVLRAIEREFAALIASNGGSTDAH